MRRLPREGDRKYSPLVETIDQASYASFDVSESGNPQFLAIA
jgi:hypothetical protein